ncbi:hypothetical protein BCR34DRAFT_594753 [Clohesyomyces aquaticus]|uniref:RHS repeat-associated core domain-containing protein n=1 Tax=Clohesyomyces aquaticus TaxID=1231657 RepID=A0A1Y1Y6B8_9PLEO|nr:hypothetical protein BCR34DRAFT_594753 [Clohesyomyces aquaticus]
MLYEYLETYDYDLAGNIMTTRHEAPQDPYVYGWTRSYYYEEQSLLSDDPKVKGNRLSRTVVGSTEEKYSYGDETKEDVYDSKTDAGRVGCMTMLPLYSRISWDMNNMMSSSSTQSFKDGIPEITYYVYNHAGHRVRKITESASPSDKSPRKQRDTLYLNGVEIQTKLSTNNGIDVRCIARISGESILALFETTNDDEEDDFICYQIGADMELDEEGQLISYEEYSPFGVVMYSAKREEVEAPRTYRFAKYEHDRETGLYHCRSRYYCPWLGRWTSPDPCGDVDGPNLYQYTRNDPVNMDDHEGTSLNFRSQSVPRGLGSSLTTYRKVNVSNVQSVGSMTNRTRIKHGLNPNQPAKTKPETREDWQKGDEYIGTFQRGPAERRISLPGISQRTQGDLQRINLGRGAMAEVMGRKTGPVASNVEKNAQNAIERFNSFDATLDHKERTFVAMKRTIIEQLRQVSRTGKHAKAMQSIIGNLEHEVVHVDRTLRSNNTHLDRVDQMQVSIEALGKFGSTWIDNPNSYTAYGPGHGSFKFNQVIKDLVDQKASVVKMVEETKEHGEVAYLKANSANAVGGKKSMINIGRDKRLIQMQSILGKFAGKHSSGLN